LAVHIFYREMKQLHSTSLLFFTARDEVYKSSWFSYESLGFIMNKTKPRQTLNTVS